MGTGEFLEQPDEMLGFGEREGLSCDGLAFLQREYQYNASRFMLQKPESSDYDFQSRIACFVLPFLSHKEERMTKDGENGIGLQYGQT